MSHPDYEHIGKPLDKLIEETAELTLELTKSMAQLVQELMKAKRFGIDNYHPETFISNRVRIHEEIADVKKAILNYEKYLDDGGE